jgi:hypothetical protein
VPENIRTNPDTNLQAALPSWTYQDFKSVLIDIHNRYFEDTQVSDFDADKNIMSLGMAGSVASLYYPKRADKEELLEYALSEAQAIDTSQAAILLPAAVVAIHPFAEGNGRTSRELYQRLLGEENLRPEAERNAFKNTPSREYIDVGTAFTEDHQLSGLANYWPYYKLGIEQRKLGIVIHRHDIEDENSARLLSDEAVAGLTNEEEADLRAAIEPFKDDDGLRFATSQALLNYPEFNSILYEPAVKTDLVGDRQLVNMHELLPAMSAAQKKEFVAALWTYRKLRAQASIDLLADELGDKTIEIAERTGEISLRSLVTERTNNLHTSKVGKRSS